VIREVGTQITLSTVARDTSGTPINTLTMALSVTKPDGTLVSPAPTVTNTGSGGIYTAPVVPDQAGLWLYRWTASGTLVDVQSDQFSVVASQRALVASMEEFKAHLRRTDTADDAMLRGYLVAATDWVENTIGGPLSVQTFTDRVGLGGWWIVPSQRPIVSVTSLTPELGSVLDPTWYVVDTGRDAIRLRWGATAGWYTLVYRAGLTVVPERVKLAGLIVAQHMWRVQNGGGGMPFPGETETAYVPSGFAVPSRALELISPDIIPGIA
jgi:hypothetical protein